MTFLSDEEQGVLKHLAASVGSIELLAKATLDLQRQLDWLEERVLEVEA